MWINFVFEQRKFSVELTGEETLIDVEKILNESYGINKDLYFYIGYRFIEQEDYYTPLKNIPEIKGKDFLEVLIRTKDFFFENLNDCPLSTKQSKHISIGFVVNQESIKISSSKTKPKEKSIKYQNSEVNINQINSPKLINKAEIVKQPTTNANLSSPRHQRFHSNQFTTDADKEAQNMQTQLTVKLPELKSDTPSPRIQYSKSLLFEDNQHTVVKSPDIVSNSSSPRHQNFRFDQNDSQLIDVNQLSPTRTPQQPQRQQQTIIQQISPRSIVIPLQNTTKQFQSPRTLNSPKRDLMQPMNSQQKPK